MTEYAFAPRLIRTSLAATLGIGLTILSGCGTQPFSPAGTSAGALVHGKAMGGELPVSGATVTLYATAANTSIVNGVYVGTATVLGSTTTGSDGSFAFNPASYTCPTNQEIYVTSYGGNGGGGTNNNILEIAMVGQCGSLNGFTDINEVTTVATAYALSSFLSIDTSGAAPVVNITAPAANASFATNVVSAGTVTKASGLLHAYQNAINLVNTGSGVANAVPPSNPNAIAPNALINTLGNILQACVNSTGGIATVTTTNCGLLFSLTPSLNGTAPTNTLQAALNIARNPFISTANVTSLFNLAAPQVAFAPTLSAAPRDWTVAISYPVPPNPVTGIGFPWTAALDADDNVYVTSPENDIYTAASAGSKLTVTSASACLFGWSSSGTFLPTITPYIPGSTPSVPGTPGNGTPGTSSWFCSKGTPATDRVDTFLTALAPDSVGNIWISNPGSYNTTTPANSNTVVLSVAASAPSVSHDYQVPVVLTKGASQPPMAIAVDKWNDVFFNTYTSSTGFENIFALAAGTGGTTSTGTYINLDAGTAPTAATAPDNGQAIRNIAFDNLGNFFGTDYGGTSGNPGAVTIGSQLSIMAITSAGSASAQPVYNPTIINKPVLGATSGTSATTDNGPWGVAVDSSNTAWVTAAGAPGQTPTNGSIGLGNVKPTGGPPVTGGTASAAITTGFTSPKGLEADGANVLWIADTTGIIPYSTSTTTYPVTGTFSETGGFNPCIPSAGTAPTANGTICTYPDTTSTKGVAIDSTGAVWFTTPDLTNANANRLIQMIGSATATWPLLATGKPGTMPQ